MFNLHLLFIVSSGTGAIDGGFCFDYCGAIDVVVQLRSPIGRSSQKQSQFSTSNESEVYYVIYSPLDVGKDFLQVCVGSQAQVPFLIHIGTEGRVNEGSSEVHDLVWTHVDESCAISDHVSEM